MASSTQERTERAAQRIIGALRVDGLWPSGQAESGNVEAAATFVVEIDGHDYHVEVAAETVDDDAS